MAPQEGVIRPMLAQARAVAGLLSLGQGLLVVLRIVDHEAPFLVGAALVALGTVLLFPTWRAPTGPRVGPARAKPLAAFALALLAGVLLYNLLRGSTLAAPELALCGYAALLLVAASRLDSAVGPVRVGTLVAYSFPLVLAPLAMWALDAALDAGGGSPLDAYLRYGLVQPMGLVLGLLGVETRLLGSTVALTTPRGELFLTVGVVCAGLYAMAVFLGILALYAWEARVPRARLAAYVVVGVVGLHLANVARLVGLALVGRSWGGEALQDFHRHAGWALFLLWTLGFWWVVLRRFEPRVPLAA